MPGTLWYVPRRVTWLSNRRPVSSGPASRQLGTQEKSTKHALARAQSLVLTYTAHRCADLFLEHIHLSDSARHHSAFTVLSHHRVDGTPTGAVSGNKNIDTERTHIANSVRNDGFVRARKM